ncbi:MAG: glycosyltransferase family 2 protein [Capsulimonadales bacterium]|nr:glycosyltransferase family 2 protein [Capsulimonadales bacterium]
MTATVSPRTIDLSLVIVTYRAKDVVRDCLITLLRRGGLDGLTAEVLLIDNASGDGTVEMVQEEFPEVRLVANRNNVGFSGGNNQGIAAAHGGYILLLNPDTLVPPGSLKKCVDFLARQPSDVAAMSCRVQSVDGSLQWTCSRRLITPWSEICRALLLDRLFSRSRLFNPEPDLGWDRRDTRAVECLLGAFMLIRREALQRIGGLDERFFLMYEDVDWCKRARDAGYRLMFWPEAHITHIGGSSWKQEPIVTFANSHLSAMKYMEKHHSRALKSVHYIHGVGMELKIMLLRWNLLRKPGDVYTIRHLAMAKAARHALRTGTVLPEKEAR